jgi:diketogulonate reductase-like aldo/keto reductase
MLALTDAPAQLQTKFTAIHGQDHRTPYDRNAPLAEQVHQSVRSSLAHFTLDGEEPYLDSLVLHSPLPNFQDTLDVWRALESHAPHAVRNLGVSNTTLPQLEALCKHAAVQPVVVQNRFHHAEGHDVQLRAFCRERGIVYQSFWTLTGNPQLARSPPVATVAHGAGTGAVAAYYALVLGLDGLSILDGTTDPAHMQEDLLGIEAVGLWAEGEGKDEWAVALRDFKALIQEP